MMMKYSLLIFVLWIFESSCQRAEQVLVEYGQSFSFDCKLDESIYFGRRLGQWSDIRENADQYASLNLKYHLLKNEKILRVIGDSAQSQHVGYYGCRKPTWSSSSMTRVYQLIIAGKRKKQRFFSDFFNSLLCKMLNHSIGRILAMVHLVHVIVRMIRMMKVQVHLSSPIKAMWICTAVHQQQVIKM